MTHLDPTAYADREYLTALRDEARQSEAHWSLVAKATSERGTVIGADMARDYRADASNYRLIALNCSVLIDALDGHDMDTEQAIEELDLCLERERGGLLGRVDLSMKQGRVMRRAA